jgi:hypothetical protein
VRRRPELLSTLAEFAAEIAKASGKPVVYKNLSEPEFKAVLVGADLPESFAGLLADSHACVEDIDGARGAMTSRTLAFFLEAHNQKLFRSVSRYLCLVEVGDLKLLAADRHSTFEQYFG